MSWENVQTYKRVIEAWNANDFDTWIGYFDPDIHWSALLEEFQGHAGIEQAWQSFKADLQLEVRLNDVRDLGDSVLALGELTGRGRTTHLNVNAEIAQLVTFRDGKIASYRDFAGHAEALKAAGLRE